MDAQASRFPNLRTFQTTELILFRKWPAPLDVIRWWMWYICITTSWRTQWSQLHCYEVLLKSSHLLWFSWAINVTDCMKCMMQKAVFGPDEPSPDLCAELLWRFSMRVCNSLPLTASEFPMKRSHPCRCSLTDWSFSLPLKNLEWKGGRAEEWRFGWCDWHGLTLQNESRGLEACCSVCLSSGLSVHAG